MLVSLNGVRKTLGNFRLDIAECGIEPGDVYAVVGPCQIAGRNPVQARRQGGIIVRQGH